MLFPASLFRSFVLRSLWGAGRAGDRLRTLLSVTSIGLGVAVVLAIQLANQAATGSFQTSIEEVSGAATLSISASDGIDELVLPRVREIAGPEIRISPLLDSTAIVPSSHEIVQILGVDFLQASLFRSTENLGGASRNDFLLALFDPRSIVVGSDFAKRYGLQTGSRVPLLINDRRNEYTVRAIVGTSDGQSLAGNVLFMDIAAAQVAFGKLGKLGRIDLEVPPERVADYAARLSAGLPPGLHVERPEVRAEQTDKMLRAFRWNLLALSYVSLVVGAFLIYNTVAVSVVRRRAEIGTLRALGLERGQTLLLFSPKPRFSVSSVASLGSAWAGSSLPGLSA